ncbi:MAG: ribonuclease R [Firmicutes bacterium]|nr:ribonuclease R [Bacillota bacterium]
MKNIIERIKNENLEFLSADKLADKLSYGSKQEKTGYYTEINKMLESGRLVLSGSSIVLPETIGVVRGKLSGNHRGFAFCVVAGQEAVPDVFIAGKDLGGALHKDSVLIKITKKLNQLHGAEGVVLKVLERNRENIVGTLEFKQNNAAMVVPDDSHYFSNIYVTNLKKIKAKHGDKVVARVTDYNTRYNQAEGEVVEVLGSVKNKGIDILGIIREHNLYEEFPQEVEQAALLLPNKLIDADKKNRTDFTRDRIVTIDPEDAKDLDDAIHIIAHKDGGFTLGVHIADVGHYVKQGSILDKEALKRGTSVYFPDRVLPMLPRPLSNGICSLNPNVERLTLSVVMDINAKGVVTDSKIYESFIKTCNRMNYSEVFAILENDAAISKKYGSELCADLKNMEKLHNILYNLRKKRGSLDFDLPEPKIILDADGKVADVIPYPRNTAHRIIESFMVLCNEVVAETMLKRTLPFVYRVHERPDALKMSNFFSFLSGFGMSLNINPESVTPKDLQKLLYSVADQPYNDVVNKVMLRSLQKARYAPGCLGHFGLAATHYCHFTSPIRRYPDLVIHRIIKALFLSHGSNSQKEFFNEFVVEASIQSSLREKLAETAERDVDDLKKAEFMLSKIGHEFDGVISGVTEFGVFVELANTVEGMARVERLPKDNYFLEEKRYTLRGTSHVYQLGGKVRVKCIGANTYSKKVDFEIIE